MPPEKRKFWPTIKKHVHILGEVRRVAYGSGTIASLYLYTTSCERDQEPAELPPARIRVIIGAAREIVCTICGDLVDWEDPPTDAYLRLMQRYPRPAGERV
jgi:hypothetical protein